MARLIGYLLLMGATYYLGGMYWSPPLLVLFWAEGILLAASFFISRLLPGRIFAEAHLDSSLERGKPSQGSITVRNYSSLPVNKICVTICCEAGGQEETQRLYGILPGKGTCSMEFQITAAHCGKLKLKLKDVKSYEALGIFYKRKKLGLKKEIWILPQICPMDLEIRNQGFFWYPQGGEMSVSKPGMEQSDYELREYREGDHKKSIHWKLQARTDQMWTRVYQSDQEAFTALYLNLYGMKEEKEEQKDAWLELLTAVLAGLLRNSVKHKVYWYNEAGGGFSMREIQTEADILRLQCTLLEEQDFQEKRCENWYEVLKKSVSELPAQVLCLDIKRGLLTGKTEAAAELDSSALLKESRRRWMIE